MTQIDYIISILESAVVGDQEKAKENYAKFRDDLKFWGMIDLVSSSNYRIVKKAKLGYIRGESFFSLVHNVISYESEIRLLKEIGDAALLMSDGLRPLLESMVLMNQIAAKIKKAQPDELYPFEIRCGISYGTGKKLKRDSREIEDYLGEPIDKLARIMSVRSDTSNFLIQDKAVDNAKEVLQEYNTFLTISPPKQVSREATKNMAEDIIYREVNINLENLFNFQEHFVPWREGIKLHFER